MCVHEAGLQWVIQGTCHCNVTFCLVSDLCLSVSSKSCFNMMFGFFVVVICFQITWLFFARFYETGVQEMGCMFIIFCYTMCEAS